MTNKEFAKSDKSFRDQYKTLYGSKSEPTKRQASKFRAKKGMVYNTIEKQPWRSA